MITSMSQSPVSLPLLATQRVCSIPANQPIRKSRMTVRRFTILVIVQLLMIVHIVQWLAVGVTLAPIEPSESMETIKHGVVTVGFIFFAIAILSTAILGRWFCGWGCHILMLQDFAVLCCTKAEFARRHFDRVCCAGFPLGSPRICSFGHWSIDSQLRQSCSQILCPWRSRGR